MSKIGALSHVYSNYDTFHVVHTEVIVDDNITVHLPNAYVANMVYVVWGCQHTVTAQTIQIRQPLHMLTGK